LKERKRNSRTDRKDRTAQDVDTALSRRVLPLPQHQRHQTAIAEPAVQAKGPDAPGKAVHLDRTNTSACRASAIGAESAIHEGRETAAVE
jgi:hypothetical protein